MSNIEQKNIPDLVNEYRKVLMDFDGSAEKPQKDGTVSADEIKKALSELSSRVDLNRTQKEELGLLLAVHQNAGIPYFTFKTTSTSHGDSSFERKVAHSILNSEVARNAVAGSGAFSDGALTLHEVVKSPNLISALYTGGVLSQLDSGDYLLAAVSLNGPSYVIRDSGSYEVKTGKYLSVNDKNGQSATIEVPDGWKIEKMNRYETYFQTNEGWVRFAALDRPGYYAVSPEKEGKQSYKIWNEFGEIVDSGEFEVDPEKDINTNERKILSFDKDGKFRIETEKAYYVRTRTTPLSGSTEYSVSTDYTPEYQASGNPDLQQAYSVHIKEPKGYGQKGTHSLYKGGVFNVETVYDKSGTEYGRFVKNTPENRPMSEYIGRPSVSELEVNGIHVYDEVFVLNNEPYFVYKTGTAYTGGSIEIRNKEGEIVKRLNVNEKSRVTGFRMSNGKIEMIYQHLGENGLDRNPTYFPIFGPDDLKM